MISVFVCSETPSQSYFECVVKRVWLYYYLFILSKQLLLPEIFLCHWLKTAPEGPPCPSDFCLPWPPHVFSALALALAVPPVLQHFLPSRLSLSAFVHVTPVWKIGTFPAAAPNILASFTLPWDYQPEVSPFCPHYERSLTALTTVYNKRIEAHLGP